MSNPAMRPGETSADYCRRMGWQPGTRLTGTDPLRRRTDTVTLTAIGRSVILAEGPNGTEEIWPLEYRHWRPAQG